MSTVLDSETISVGRDGASDAICFISAGSRRSSSARSAAATTARRNGCRRPRWRATAARWSTSCGASPTRSGDKPHLRLLKKSFIGALVIVVDRRRRHDVDRAARSRRHGRQVQAGAGRDREGADARRERQPADDHDRRLRPPPRRQEARPEAALGHDHPGAHRPRQGSRAAVAAARPEGRDPRPRHRQAERRLHAGRAEALDQDGQEPHRARDQPLRRRQLPRLRRGRERARLRVRRHRPPLLQQQRRASASARTTR